MPIRDAHCERCPLHSEAHGEDRCVIATSPSKPIRLLVVTKFPASRAKIAHILKTSGIVEPFALTSAVRCRTWTLQPSKADIKACGHYLAQEIDALNPQWILTFGNEALLAVTGHSGIMKHRGKVYPTKRATESAFGTLSPAMVEMQPGQEKGFRADLRLFASLLSGRQSQLYPKVPYRRAQTPEDLEEMLTDMSMFAHGVSVDIESNAFDEFKPDSRIISISFTLWGKGDTDARMVWAVPLWHPQSWLRDRWQEELKIIGKILCDIPVRVAHNGKFDGRWLNEFGVPITFTFDTMLAAHILDENRSKALASLAREELTVEDWKIKNTDLVNQPLGRVLKYNAEDTLNTARLYFALRAQFIERPKLARLFKLLMMPASNLFMHVERTGIWIDRELLHKNWKIAKAELARIENELMAYVPDVLPKHINGKGVNFNPSHFMLWWLFEHLGLPVLQRSAKTGKPSMAEAVMFQLLEEHPVIALLMERTKWYKYDSCFFSAYDELMDSDDRMHTTFKLSGTVTGRLSAGKADETKVQAKPQRGVNPQQVPRDRFVRGVIGAAPGCSLATADYSQVEFRLSAMLANAESVIDLYAAGKDVHLVMASRLTGKPEEAVLKEERKRAKWVNFGFIYGMQWRTFIDTVWRGYQIRVPEAEAKLARRTFFQTFPEFLTWHEKQRRFARENGFVESLIGRVRHLPNIRSTNRETRAEAERQAINSPVQSLASDMTLLSVLRVNEELRRKGYKARTIGTVHDEALYEIPNPELPYVLPIIHRTMEHLPLQRMFGVKLTVPIIANVKLSKHWDTDEEGGELKELTVEEIYNYGS